PTAPPPPPQPANAPATVNAANELTSLRMPASVFEEAEDGGRPLKAYEIRPAAPILTHGACNAALPRYIRRA
ncbi:MAG: hypothetical protein AB1918_14660, partial [Pseudomonadota bacterium]